MALAHFNGELALEQTPELNQIFPITERQWFSVRIEGVASFWVRADDELDALLEVDGYCKETYDVLGFDPNTFDTFIETSQPENTDLPIWKYREATMANGEYVRLNEIYKSFPTTPGERQKAIKRGFIPVQKTLF